MKLVVAVIKPHQVEAVTDALHAIDIAGMTVTEVRGHGRQRGHTEVYRGGEYNVDFLPKSEVKVLVHDSTSRTRQERGSRQEAIGSRRFTDFNGLETPPINLILKW